MYLLAWSVKCLEAGLKDSPLTKTVFAFILFPNSTAAIKLLPETPYLFFVFILRLAKEGIDPQLPGPSATGQLGFESSNLPLLVR